MNAKVERVEAICSWCGKVKLVTPKYKESRNFSFCSKECRSNWLKSDKNTRKRQPDTACLQCGNLFVGYRTKRFCSSKCYGQYNAENPGVLQTRSKPIPRTWICKQCDKEYTTINREHSQFCSHKCASLGKIKQRVKTTCLKCGEPFEHMFDEIRKYCSQDCANHKFINQSKAEREIIEKISKLYDVISDFVVIDGKIRFKPDVMVGNKIIEYYGDYWHCNPILYESSYYNSRLQMTAEEKWEFDKNRISLLENKGYDVLIIWESDFKVDRETQIKKIFDFLEK